ncbi:T-cell immunoglobulin and mucin domain-containing protein 4 isoform X2 [Kogia breviceps]|uniref:T-cell immunoglobulin and mucin domain-containing protein 4 isoform X2 n=1 Tax=Kogia breviceps TaxID=27615 RepID=UPI0034D3068B
MSKGPLILWLMIALGRLYLTPAASEIVVRAFWGQSVTLPCTYSSWSPNSNSMCWGKGQCPHSKCNDELLYTDGTRVVSRKLPNYQLLGNIQRGDVSLTIFNTKEDNSGVYCCRIEVPGWFNDVKKNIRLELRRGPTTTRSTTTHRPTTAAAMTTTTAVLPTASVVATPDLPATPPLQMRTTAALTTTAATCPLTTWDSLREEDTILLTLEPSTEGPILTAESETVLPRTSQRSTEATSADTALLTSKGSERWVLQSTPQELMREASDSVIFQPRDKNDQQLQPAHDHCSLPGICAVGIASGIFPSRESHENQLCPETHQARQCWRR